MSTGSEPNVEEITIDDIPTDIDDEEPLARRISPGFRRDDGRISSQAFTDTEMSVDRHAYRSADRSLLGYEGFGLAKFKTAEARKLGQEVVARCELLNPAHAQVNGKKTGSIRKALARASSWVVPIPEVN